MPRKKKAIAQATDVVLPAAETTEIKAPQKRGRKPKDAAAKKANAGHKATAPSVVLQFAGKETDVEAIVDKAKAAYRAEHPRGGIFTCKVYVKPEEGMAYYVINKVEGKFLLFGE